MTHKWKQFERDQPAERVTLQEEPDFLGRFGVWRVGPDKAGDDTNERLFLLGLRPAKVNFYTRHNDIYHYICKKQKDRFKGSKWGSVKKTFFSN
jgi:hypothetical protein